MFGRMVVYLYLGKCVEFIVVNLFDVIRKRGRLDSGVRLEGLVRRVLRG